MSSASSGPSKDPVPTKRPGAPKAGAASRYTGRVVARCLVGERLGRGATSHVFRAHYEPLGKDIALKILSQDSAGAADLRDRFLSEARAVAKVSHENIVKVLDVVEDQGLFCILMELVEGPTLQDRLDDEGVIKPRHAFRIAGQIARALEAAHEEKIVHRDVKPANVMLVGPAGDETVKVVDFGLAVQQEMNRVGTPLFMSPEAAQGKRIDEKSDVYALGICLYRMLTGVLPFTGATVKEILAAQVNAELVPPSEQRIQLGKTYDKLLKKLLVKSKGYRPAAAEAADLLEDIADDLEERELGVRRERRRRKRAAPKHSKVPGAGFWAGVAVAAVAVVAVAFFLSGKDKPAPVAEAPIVQQKVEPPAPVVEPAETAFREVEAWAKENAADRKGEIAKWKEFEKRFPSTKWATLATQRRKSAEFLFYGTAGERPAPPPPPPKESPAVLNARLQERIKNFDFDGASQVFNSDELEPPAGTDPQEFDRKQRRVSFLREHFRVRMDAGLASTKGTKRVVPAKAVFPDAKDGEILVGANSEGGVVAAADGSSRHTLKWSTATVEAFFKRPIVDTALDTEVFEDDVVLAALAAEFGQPSKTVAKFRDIAIGKAGSDEAMLDVVRTLFGE